MPRIQPMFIAIQRSKYILVSFTICKYYSFNLPRLSWAVLLRCLCWSVPSESICFSRHWSSRKVWTNPEFLRLPAAVICLTLWCLVVVFNCYPVTLCSAAMKRSPVDYLLVVVVVAVLRVCWLLLFTGWCCCYCLLIVVVVYRFGRSTVTRGWCSTTSARTDPSSDSWRKRLPGTSSWGPSERKSETVSRLNTASTKTKSPKG